MSHRSDYAVTKEKLQEPSCHRSDSQLQEPSLCHRSDYAVTIKLADSTRRCARTVYRVLRLVLGSAGKFC